MRSLSRGWRVLVVLAFGVSAIIFLGACDDIAEVGSYYDAFTIGRSADDQAADASGRTGDEAVDGILTVGPILEDIRKADIESSSADYEMERGNTDKAAGHLDKAIALRPEDMRFRRNRAAVAVIGNDLESAEQQWAEQDRIAAEQGQATQAWYWEGSFEDAAELAYGLLNEVDMLTATDAQKEQGVLVYTRMAECYETAADIHTENLDIEAATENLRVAKLCRDTARLYGAP